MPTSSIFANVKITDPKKAEAFIDAMDEAANRPRKEYTNEETRYLVNDPEKIREIFAKRKPKEALDIIEEKGKLEKAREMAIILHKQGVATEIIAKAAKVDNKVIEAWLEDAGHVID